MNADKIPVPAQPEVLLHCLMDIAEALLAVGAEVNRVEDTLTRMGTAYGAVRMNAFVITSSIVVTMTLPSGRDITQTRPDPDSRRHGFHRSGSAERSEPPVLRRSYSAG